MACGRLFDKLVWSPGACDVRGEATEPRLSVPLLCASTMALTCCNSVRRLATRLVRSLSLPLPHPSLRTYGAPELLGRMAGDGVPLAAAGIGGGERLRSDSSLWDADGCAGALVLPAVAVTVSVPVKTFSSS